MESDKEDKSSIRLEGKSWAITPCITEDILEEYDVIYTQWDKGLCKVLGNKTHNMLILRSLHNTNYAVIASAIIFIAAFVTMIITALLGHTLASVVMIAVMAATLLFMIAPRRKYIVILREVNTAIGCRGELCHILRVPDGRRTLQIPYTTAVETANKILGESVW